MGELYFIDLVEMAIKHEEDEALLKNIDQINVKINDIRIQPLESDERTCKF